MPEETKPTQEQPKPEQPQPTGGKDLENSRRPGDLGIKIVTGKPVGDPVRR